MHQLTGAFTVEIELDRLVEQIAQRVAAILTDGREPDPAQGGGDRSTRGRHDPDEIGLGDLP